MYKEETRAEIVSDTVYFKHKYITMLTKKADQVIKVARDVAKAIGNNIPSQVPVTNYDAMKKVLKIFVQVAKMKLLEEKWEKPAVVRVLRQLNTAKTPRVETQWEERAIPPRVEEEMPMRG